MQEDLNAILSPKMRIVVLGGTERSARAAAEDLQNSGVPCEYRDDAKTLSLGRVTVLPGSLSAGFEYPTANFALITHGHFAAAPKGPENGRKTPRRFTAFPSWPPGTISSIRPMASACSRGFTSWKCKGSPRTI